MNRVRRCLNVNELIRGEDRSRLSPETSITASMI